MDVKTTLIIEVIVLFIESTTHIVLMSLNKLLTNPLNFSNFASELLEDIRLCYEFDQSLNFWTEDYEHKCKDISSGVTGGIFLKDSIYL